MITTMLALVLTLFATRLIVRFVCKASGIEIV